MKKPNTEELKHSALVKIVPGLLNPGRFGHERITLDECATLMALSNPKASRAYVFKTEHVALEKLRTKLKNAGITCINDIL